MDSFVGPDGALDGALADALDHDGPDALAQPDPFAASDGLADGLLWDYTDAATPEPADPGDPTDPTEPTEPTEPEVSLPGPDGVVFSGPATYDATGDGTNDTVVMQSSDGTVTSATDYDGDGVADQVTVVSPDGTVTVSAADDEGRWRPIASGRVTEDGGIVFDRAVSSPDPGTEQPGEGPTVEPVVMTQSAGMVFIDADGDQHRLGAPDQDLDGDGVDESVAVRTGDGHLLVVTDTDGDGVADRMIDVDERTGAVSWSAASAGATDGTTAWDVTSHGHVDVDGNLVVEQPGESVVVEVDGRPFDAGHATVDADGDGIADTVALAGPGGSVQYYQDTDGDGFADRAWTADSAGQVTARYVLDIESGTWSVVGT